MVGGLHGVERADRAFLDHDPVELAIGRNGVGGALFRGARVPVADHLHDLQSLVLVEHRAHALVVVAIDAVARQAGDFEHLAGDVALGGLDAVDHGLRLHPAELELILVDLHDLVGIEHVVEGDEHGPGALRALHDRVERGGIDRVDDDRVVTGGDVVVDGRDLRGRIVADRDHLEVGRAAWRCRAGRPKPWRTGWP